MVPLFASVLVALLPASARADDGLTRQQIAEAEWSRDVATLLTSTYRPEDLPRLAVALGRTRDPAVLDRLRLLAEQPDVALRAAAASALGWVPGSAPILRARLDEETVVEVRVRLLRAIGQQGDATDVPRLTALVARPGAEGAAAAEAIGLLARRGVPAAEAVPPLVAALGAVEPARLRAVAFALGRLRPVGLSPADRDRLARAYDRATDEATRAWLLPAILAHADRAEAKAWRLRVLDEPWRAARVALFGVDGVLDRDDLAVLATSDDPWLAARAAERLAPPSPPADPVASLPVALSGDTPKARSDAAARVLVGEPPLGVLEALASTADPVVREMAVDALAVSEAPEAWEILLGRAEVETDPSVLGALLPALEAGVRAGRALSAPAAVRLRELAATGPFLVRRRAFEAAAAAGLVAGTLAPVLPGPPDLVLDLDRVARIRSARVQTTAGEFVVELDPETAPFAVATFAWLAERDVYDGLPFHRVVPAFVVQTGDPRGDGHGGPGWFVPDEVSDLPFEAGAVGMATAGPDTGGSQWFVTTTPQPHLAGSYTRFGRVTRGLDTVRRLGTEDRVLDVIVERLPGERK